MRRWSFTLTLITALTAPVSAYSQELEAWVSIPEQAIYIFVDGTFVDKWPVSTARKPFKTPVGIFRSTPIQPFVMQPRHWSKKYHSWMTWSVFFNKGVAIHGIPKSEIPRLGSKASHGCVRLLTENAERFYELALEAQGDITVIVADDDER